MTISLYPSRLEGEPLERYEHQTIKLDTWFRRNVKGYEAAKRKRISVEIDGCVMKPTEWPQYILKPDTDVRIYEIPQGTGLEIAAWAAVAVAVGSAAYSILMMSQMGAAGGYSSSTGTGLDLNPAKANSAKLGDPIREVFGRRRIYPDYLVQPVGRFDPNNPENYRMDLYVCLGMGNFSFSGGDIRVGDTPISSLGSDFSYAVFSPGADVSVDQRTENWYSSTEVGGTSNGSGLDIGNTGPEAQAILADSVTVAGPSLTFNGLDKDDGNDNDVDDNKLPDSWVVGATVEITVPDSLTISTDGLYNRFFGNSLTELMPFVGMPVQLDYNSATYDLYIASYSSGSAASAGVEGSPAILTANAALSSYDFSASPVTLRVAFNGSFVFVPLSTNYGDMYTLINYLNTKLNAIGLSAADQSDRIKIYETVGPYQGGTILYEGLDASTFSATDGVATVVASGAVAPNLTLAYTSATGAAFYGLPTGELRVSIAHRGAEYKLLTTDGSTVTVSRLINGVVDQAWPGFSWRTALDFYASGINESNNWIGPFLACPSNEKVDCFEINIAYPSGLCGFDSKGNKRDRHTGVDVQYRVYGSETSWATASFTYVQKNVSGLGFTHRINLPMPGLVEVRVRRQNEQGSNNARDNAFWQALRGRLATRPSSYPKVTTMALSVVTGGKLAAQSDRRINVVATRLYDTGINRSISGAFYHVARSINFSESDLDKVTVDALEAKYWTPRGEYFDFEAVSSDKSVLDIFQAIANAGMGYFLLSDGLTSLGREGIKPWTGIISPQETTEPMQTSFIVPSDDDYDGVDVTYINGTTWAEETVQCRLPGNPTPRKIESYTLDGVIDQDRAYRIGMRRLRKYAYQRLSHSTSTELDALAYNYMDRIVLTDDIPGSETISCLIMGAIEDAEQSTLTVSVSEPLDWSFNNPRCLIRFQDGRASTLLTPNKVDDYTLILPLNDAVGFDSWIMDDPVIEPPRLVFCSSSKVGYDAMISEITPGSDGTCSVSAAQYRDLFYEDDDAAYPGDVS